MLCFFPFSFTRPPLDAPLLSCSPLCSKLHFLSLTLFLSQIGQSCMYVCMHVLNRISQLLALSFSQLSYREWKRQEAKAALAWRWSWFAVRLKLKLKMEHDQLIKTTRLIRTRTIDQPFLHLAHSQALQPQHPIICGSAQAQILIHLLSSRSRLTLGQPDPRVKLI